MYFLDIVSDSFMVFGGEPGVRGRGRGPFEMRAGMNEFLRGVGVTFRRDNETNRPRINKEASRLDREQKAAGETITRLRQVPSSHWRLSAQHLSTALRCAGGPISESANLPVEECR